MPILAPLLYLYTSSAKEGAPNTKATLPCANSCGMSLYLAVSTSLLMYPFLLISCSFCASGVHLFQSNVPSSSVLASFVDGEMYIDVAYRSEKPPIIPLSTPDMKNGVTAPLLDVLILSAAAISSSKVLGGVMLYFSRISAL